MNFYTFSEGLLDNFLSQLFHSSFQFCVGQSLKAPSHLFSRYLTASIEINGGSGSNETLGIEEFIKQKCDKTNHFRLTPGRSQLRNYLRNVRHIPPRRHMKAYGFDNLNTEDKEETEENFSDIENQLTPIPNNWNVFFWYKGTLIRVIRNVQGPNLELPGHMETLKITSYLTRNKNVLVDMLNEARGMVEEKPEKMINYYRARSGGYEMSWSLVRHVHPRGLSWIILREGVTKAIQEDIEDFLANRKWYKERGIPYRRGYLLYGPPGCGKTSFVKAISGEIGYDIYEVQLSDGKITDQNLNNLLSKFGRKTILLFEDIDAVFVARPEDEEKQKVNGKDFHSIREAKGGVTFSGLLNAIDGVASEEDYIVFMTTNHIEKLDPALIRPGRIDLKQLIDYPDEQQIITFFKKFYPDCKEDLPSKFARAVIDLKGKNVSIAEIQGIFLRHKKEPEETLFDLESLVNVN